MQRYQPRDSASRSRQRLRAPRLAGGFTLVELVIVIVILGVLAVAVLPKFFERITFDARAFHDQALAAVRHAQKVAIAQRRTVWVNVTASGIQVCYDPGCGTPVTDPVRGGALSVAAPAGVSLSPASFRFDGLGRPSTGVSITVTGDVPRMIVVESETGYVHG
ncbi:pilus assembly FimT family protein [Pelomicrobium methylotrophicum]|nr:type II secretion system protein [Pelomicrobium methylotrophicum]